MIKLIASDMDGTLLDENSQVPLETYDLILKLKEKGVNFVVSSGRRYETLCKMFAPVKDEMDFVASNGAQVYVDGKLVDREVFSHAAIMRLKKAVDKFDCLHLVLFDRDTSYLFADSEQFEREVDKDLPNELRIHDVPSADTCILKASIHCNVPEEIMDMSYALSREVGSDFVFAPSSAHWIDGMQVGVSKSTGIMQVMEARGIEAEEVMAFGDSMNDYEILSMVGESRAMANARYAIKAISKKTIGFNTEQAVQAEMHKLLVSL